MPRTGLTLLLCCILPGAGCERGADSGAPQEAAVATPDQRFAAQGLRITEMRDGRVLWRGTVASAAGDDLETTTVEQISLRREPQGEGESALTIDATRGELRLADGQARFEEVRIRDAQANLELTAASARYVEAQGQILAEGPIDLRGPGLHARAHSGVIHIGDRRLDLAGPVRGTWEP